MKKKIDAFNVKEIPLEQLNLIYGGNDFIADDAEGF
ncbi:MAG: hypothetical protein ACI8ZM_001966 [Crocinitomix sp.]|jgi:hypothetical protein